MDAIRMHWRTLCADERGATAIEYGLLVALISIALISGLTTLGGGSGGMWTTLGDQVSKASTRKQ